MLPLYCVGYDSAVSSRATPLLALFNANGAHVDSSRRTSALLRTAAGHTRNGRRTHSSLGLAASTPAAPTGAETKLTPDTPRELSAATMAIRLARLMLRFNVFPRDV